MHKHLRMKLFDYIQFIIVLFMILVQLSRTFDVNDTMIKLRYSRHATNDVLTKVEFPLNGENITLNLKKSYLIGTRTPVWLLRQSYRDSFIEETDPFTVGNAVQFYVDEDENASFAVINDHENDALFVGIYGLYLIKPMDFSKFSQRTKRSINGENSTNIDSNKVIISDFHKISEISKFEFTKIINSLLPKRREYFDENGWKKNNNVRKIREAPENPTVYPEILIIADYNIKFPTLSSPQFHNFLMYLIVFWNSVDLRFRELQNPRIRLHISGIVVAMSHESVPFFQLNLHENRIKPMAAINSMQYWMSDHKKIFPMKSYDISVAMTNLPLCTKGDTQCKSTSTTGIASRIGGYCAQDSLPFTIPTAIIHDDLDFRGILRATHEIGHIFGADHDGARNNEDCPESGDNIMATTDDYAQTKNTWSECSKRSISKFFKKDRIDCVHNVERSRDAGDNIFLPISLLDQCNSRGFMYACNPTPRSCEALLCYNTGWKGFWTLWLCTNTGSAVEGSPCGRGICRNQRCIPTKYPLSGDFGLGI